MKYKLLIAFTLLTVLVLSGCYVEDSKEYTFYAYGGCYIEDFPDGDKLRICLHQANEKKISYLELQKIKNTGWLPEVEWHKGILNPYIEGWRVYNSEGKLILNSTRGGGN